MFERYTEKARQCIFFARYEAGQAGSVFIEPEHLLLGMARADPGIFSRLGPNINWDTDRSKLATSLGVSSNTSREMPLSDSSGHALDHAGKECERLQHPCIECRHLLLGLLGQESTVAAQFLREQHIDRERILADFDVVRPEPRAGEPPTAGVPASLRERLQELRGKPGVVLGQMGGPVESRGGYNGRGSASYAEDDWHITETHQFCDGHGITTIERTRVSEDGKTLSYSIDITGPGGETHRHAMDFPLGA